ncbi:response regulator [Thermodesulfobacteriota bacterium]
MEQKILLVDDEEGIRKVLSIFLEDCGYQVLSAENGEKAYRLFREMRPPIVLTDIKMPGMDGIQLLQKIKAENSDTEVIMITGHGEMELAIQSLKYDATDFITKPINDEVLEIALKRAQEKIALKSKLHNYTVNLEQLVEEKTKKLIEVEKLAVVGQTVAGLAHAIKNVAGGLSGGAFVLEKGIELDNPTYLRQGWDMVKKNVGRMKNMALDLLNYAKEREPAWQLCNPNQPAQEVYDLMHTQARKYGIDLQLKLNEDLAEGWLDPEGIHRCLLNLVTNALDACTELSRSHKSGKVIIRSRKIEGWTVEYQVEDNGCGMEKEVRDKIFQVFFSTKGSRGTGLGLMITKKIIDEHKGIIDIESQKEKGTIISIRLPENGKIQEHEA